MNDTTKKPIAQGVVEYGLFRAEISYYDDGNMTYTITMAPFETTEYDENMSVNRWEEDVKTQLQILHWRIHDFESACWNARRNRRAV